MLSSTSRSALAALAPRGLWPARYGCARIAASLLSEGTGARARTLHDLVARALERSLPGGLDGGVTRAELGAPHDEVLACAAATLVPLMRALTPRLRARELTRVFELECELLPAVVRMEAAGVGVDVIRFEQIVSAWRAERRDLTSETDDSEAALAARSARLARQVGEAVGERTGLPVRYVDERYSSVDAHRQLIEAGMSRERRKVVIDQQAAVIVLQAWLDHPELGEEGG